MNQGSSEWHAWRHGGIGASEVASILGCSPYQTAYQLWEEKRLPVANEGGDNMAMARGREHEPMVRAAYAFETDREYIPECFEHPEYSFLRASLDGWDAENKEGIEIKSVGSAKIDEPIPYHHLVQVQTQMLVCAVDHWTYIRTTDGVNLKIERIEADQILQAEIFQACLAFWSAVQSGIPPSYQANDWVPDDSVIDLVKTWRKNRAAGRAPLLAACAGRKRTFCDGVKISTNPPRISEFSSGVNHEE